MAKFKVIKKKEEANFFKMSSENRKVYLYSFFKNEVDVMYFNGLIDDDIAERRKNYQRYKFFWENEGLSPSLNYINENCRMIFVTGKLFEHDITTKSIVMTGDKSGTISKGKIIVDSILLLKNQSSAMGEHSMEDFWIIRNSDTVFMIQYLLQLLDVYVSILQFIPIKKITYEPKIASDIIINNKSKGYQSELISYNNEVLDNATPIYSSSTYIDTDQFTGTANEIIDEDITSFIELLNDLNFLNEQIDIYHESSVIYAHYSDIIGDYTKHIEDQNVIEIISSALKVFTVLLYFIDQIIEERAKVNPLSDLAVGFKEAFKDKKALNRTSYYIEYVSYIIKSIKPDEYKKFRRYFDDPIKTLMYLYHTYISTNMQYFASDYKIVVTNDTDFAEIMMKHYKYRNVISEQDNIEFRNIFKRFDSGDHEPATWPKLFNYSDVTLLKTKKYYDIHEAILAIPFEYKSKVAMNEVITTTSHKINENSDTVSIIHQVTDVLRKNYIADITDKMLDEIGIPWKTIREDNVTKENYYNKAKMFTESLNYKFHLDFKLEYQIVLNKTYQNAKETFYRNVYNYIKGAKNKQVIAVADFLRDGFALAAMLDISEFEIENKKIKNELIKIARTNAFYNLTPEYKIQIGFEGLTQDKKEELLDKIIEEKKQKLKELMAQ